jgi:hypothetical protein
MKRSVKLATSLAVVSAAVSLVAACGGGSDAGSPNQASGLLSSIGIFSVQPTNFTVFTNLLDSNYSQDGFSAQQLRDMLAADAAAIPNDVSFPRVSFNNPVISNCNASNVCDLTVTASNSDADAVSVTMTLKVIGTASGYKLYGSQTDTDPNV